MVAHPFTIHLPVSHSLEQMFKIPVAIGRALLINNIFDLSFLLRKLEQTQYSINRGLASPLTVA